MRYNPYVAWGGMNLSLNQQQQLQQAQQPQQYGKDRELDLTNAKDLQEAFQIIANHSSAARRPECFRR